MSGLDPNAMDEQVDLGTGTQPGLTTLRGSLVTAQASLAAQSAILGPNNPTILALKREIANLTKAVGEEQTRILKQSREAFQLSQGQRGSDGCGA